MPTLLPACPLLALKSPHRAESVLVAPLVLTSCNRVVEVKPTKEVEVLYKIQSAYDLAYNKAGRPLQNYDELKPFLADVQNPNGVGLAE